MITPPTQSTMNKYTHTCICHTVFSAILFSSSCNENSTAEDAATAAADEDADAVQHNKRHKTEDVRDIIATRFRGIIMTATLECVVVAKDPHTVGKDKIGG